MSSGTTGEGTTSGPEQDPWSDPVDFGQPGSGTTPPADPGGSEMAAPGAWSQPAPSAWSQPAPAWTPPAAATQPVPPVPQAQPPQGGYAAAASGDQQPPATPPYPHAFSPSAADPWTAPQGPYQPPAAQHGYQAYRTPAAARNNPVAIAALVCGIAQFLGGLLLVGNIVLAIPAVICGAIGLRQVNQRGERGRGMAIAGLVLGILGVGYFLLVVIVLVVAGVHVSNTG
jgi:hypothetical protein